MKFVLKPSLQHMILVKIVASLWNQKDVRCLILMMKLHFVPRFIPTCEKWKNVEDRVLEKVPHLFLSHLLKEKVLSYIRPIGIQILEWIKFHFSHFNLRLDLPAAFCWTPQGTIDRKKTAEVLIKDDNLDASMRYKIACIYCLEDGIHKFWKSMPEVLKESISNKSRIINFWSLIMRGRGLDDISYGSEFHQAACSDNMVGAEYFLQKLTPSEREHYLVNTAQYVRDAGVLWFLLSEMEEEQQIEVFKKNPSRMLNCFLEWPLQSFFIKIANCIWDYLSKESYNSLLRDIVDKVTDGHTDWNYKKLFREFWQESPNTLKNFIVNDIHKNWLLPSFCNVKDKETFRLIFKDATPTVREKLIYSDNMYKFFQRSIRANEWDFLEFCILECFPSKSEMLKFKEEFEKSHYLKSPYFKEQFERSKQKWDQIFICPDDSLSKYHKRSVEEGECSSSKRFRSLQ